MQRKKVTPNYCTGTEFEPNSILAEENAGALCPASKSPLPIIEPVTFTSPAKTSTLPFLTSNVGTATLWCFSICY